MKINYNSNNSGGSFWLSDEDWENLEDAGWVIDHTGDFGGIPTVASIEAETPAEAIRGFEKITKQDVSDEGCNCCGPPHSFSWDGGYASGESILSILHPNKDTNLSKRQLLEQIAKEEEE